MFSFLATDRRPASELLFHIEVAVRITAENHTLELD